MKHLLLPSLLLCTISLSAQFVELDTDFNTDGTFEYIEADPSDNSPNALFIQPGEKIIAAGSLTSLLGDQNFGIIRLTTDGNPDNTFDTDGIVTNSFSGGQTDYANAAAMLSDGKFFLAGYSQGSYGAIAKYNANGSLDNAFSANGWMPIADMLPVDIAVQTNGAVIVIDNGLTDFWARRYNANGTIDNTFDTDGEITLDFEGTSNWNNVVHLDANQKIMLAGRAYIQGDHDFAIARINSDGSLDNTFSSDGKVTIPKGITTDEVFFITTQSDGKILVAGNTSDGQETNIMVTRLLADGSIDNTYGTAGTTVIDVDVKFTAAAVQNDGKIILTGNAYNDNASDYTQIFIARLDADGTLDQTFASGGWFLKPTTNYLENSTALELQSDGKILVGAKVKQTAGNDSHWAIYRYTNNYTSIEENTANTINIYPNPATNTLTINTDLNLKNAQLQIHNAQGQLVIHSSFDVQRSTFDISSLNSGIYFLSLTNGTEVVSKKFVKE